MPSMCLMRPPSESPKTRMNRNELRIGAATVCVHSFSTRCDSRPMEQTTMHPPPQTPAGRYIFDQGRHDEHERLASMELLWDPGTRTVIESLGIASGWRCLEIGAGAGSIPRWLAGRGRPPG